MRTIDLLKFIRHQKKMPSKFRRWYYQFPDQNKQELYKEGNYWFYAPPKGGQIGNSSLTSAKGDLLYSGAKVWSELQD